MAKKPLVNASGTTSQLTSADALEVPGAFQQSGIAAPAPAPTGSGIIYFDSAANTFQVSQNGSAYQNLLGVPTTRQVIAGTGLSGGGALSADVTISMPNVGTAGTYGSSALIPSFTTDAQGRITSVTNNIPQFSTFAYLASSAQAITAPSNQIVANTSLVVLSNTSGSTVTLTSSPVINCPVPCVTGQVLLIFNSRASTNTVTIPRGVASGIALGTASRQLTPGAVLSLVFDGTYWIETAFATATL